MNFIKTQLDDYIGQLSGKAIAFYNFILTIGAVMTLADWLDIGSKAVTFFITIIVGLLSARYYVLRNRKLQKEIELKDQELYKAIQENKHRSNGKV